MKPKEEHKVMLISLHDENGFEIPDPTPIALPVDFERPPTIQELVQRLVKYEMSAAAAAAGEESFEEADDFEVGDEPELRSPYELDDEQQAARLSDFVEEAPAPQVPKPEPKGKVEPEPPAKVEPAK